MTSLRNITIGIVVLICAYAWFIMLPYTESFAADKNPSALGLTFGYNAEITDHFFTVRTATQIQSYHDFIQIWDNLFPFVYGALFVLWFRFLFRSKWALILPLLMIAADIGENFTELAMLQNFEDSGEISGFSVKLGSLLTQTKWTLAGLNVAFFIYGGWRHLREFLARKAT